MPRSARAPTLPSPARAILRRHMTINERERGTARILFVGDVVGEGTPRLGAVNLGSRTVIPNVDHPYDAFQRQLEAWAGNGLPELAVVDFHGESVSDKQIFAWTVTSLTTAVAAQPDTLDPQATAATSAFAITKSLYDTLAQVSQQGEIVPSLASSWDISQAALTCAFHLKDATFADGSATVKGGPADHTSMARYLLGQLASFLVTLWAALTLVFAVRVGWFPVVGLPPGGVLAALPGFVLPALTLAAARRADRPADPRPRAGRAERRLRVCRGGAGCHPRPPAGAPRPAQLRRRPLGAGGQHRRHRAAGGGVAQLPGAGRAAAHPELGKCAAGRALLPHGAVLGGAGAAVLYAGASHPPGAPPNTSISQVGPAARASLASAVRSSAVSASDRAT